MKQNVNRSKWIFFVPIIAIAVVVLLKNNPSMNSPENVQKEAAITNTSQPLDIGVSLPFDAKFVLNDEPTDLGDAANLTLAITSKIADANVHIEYILPTDIQAVSGMAEWNGIFALEETKTFPIAVLINSEEAQTVQAKLTITKGNYTFTKGVAYHFDLGESEVSDREEVAVSGYEGGNSLNIIKPKK